MLKFFKLLSHLCFNFKAHESLLIRPQSLHSYEFSMKKQNCQTLQVDFSEHTLCNFDFAYIQKGPI